MKIRFAGALAAALAMIVAAQFSYGGQQEDRLAEVATNENQWTGIAVSESGRIFVNFPRWAPSVPVSVGELDADGAVRPYPNRELNSWKFGEEGGDKFICVQSVYIDDKNRLWILDPANPLFGGVIEGGPKLMRVDLAENTVDRSYHFDRTIAPKMSYLNDVRVDTATETAFITDSGKGAIIVVDLSSGSARRLLDDHPSTKAEDTVVEIDGNPIALKVHSDGIALDAEGGWLYYQALTGRTLYRVPTEALRDGSLDSGRLEAKIETFAEGGVSDGLLFAGGGVYLSALEDGAVKFVDGGGRVNTVVTDSRIIWPDSFALGPDGAVYFTTSQIHLGPKPPTPYRILKILPDEKLTK